MLLLCHEEIDVIAGAQLQGASRPEKSGAGPKAAQLNLHTPNGTQHALQRGLGQDGSNHERAILIIGGSIGSELIIVCRINGAIMLPLTTREVQPHGECNATS